MLKRVLAILVALTLAPLSLGAQSTGRPAYDVVSVRRNTSGGETGFFSRQGRQLTATNYRLRQLILNAYRLQPFQLIGGPAWIDTDRFDIIATSSIDPAPSPSGGPPGAAELMMQSLLADRFALQVRAETRDLPIYELVIARQDRRLGPRLQPADAECAVGAGAPGAAPQRCGIRGGPGQFTAGSLTMGTLAAILSGQAGRSVRDRTGLTGAFKVEVEFAPDPFAPDGDRPSLFTALEEQLGLKLESERGPVEVLVIDRVQPPTEN